MTKRKLKGYISELTKEQLEEQIVDLYIRFKDVKQYYDFAFNPKEDKLLEESKFKISKEYFPIGRRKAKLRRSVAQKIIKNCRLLQVDTQVLIEIMFFNLEIAITYREEKSILQESFYKSMLRSFEELVLYIDEHALLYEYKERLNILCTRIEKQAWFNYPAFEKTMEKYALL
jgi:hypothetical protein